MKLGPAAATVAACALGLCARSAQANGRFPAAGQVVVDPGDAGHVVLRTTYGILQTADAGKTWQWICEQPVGYGGIEDPAIAVTADGTLLAGIFAGLSASHDRGCSWGFAGGPLDQQYTIDIAVERQSASRAVAVTSTGRPEATAVVAETLDNGQTWTQAGAALPLDFHALTLEVAASRPQRIYVSGVAGASHDAFIERTDDRGKTWTELPFDLGRGDGLYIGAIDPADPDRVYARVDAGEDDELLASDDGAATWAHVLKGTGEMLGFALSPDGTKIAAGGPKMGLYVAGTGDLEFKQVSTLRVKCLKWHDSGLYACADEFQDGFTLGLSQDDGATFHAVYHLPDLSPLECAPGTATAMACPAAWPGVASVLGVKDAWADAGSPEAPPGGDAPPAAPLKSESGCGVRPTPGGEREGALSALLALGISTLRRRRTPATGLARSAALRGG